MKRTHLLLLAIVALNVGYAILGQVWVWFYMPDGNTPVAMRLAIPAYWAALLGILLFWCRADATDRRLGIPIGQLIIMSLLFPIGVPHYFFRTYPLPRALAHTGLAIAFVAFCVGATWLAARLSYRYFATAA